MRFLLVVMLAGCGVDTSSTPDDLHLSCSDPNSTTDDCFQTPVGTTCNSAKAPLCATGEGFCAESICRHWCEVVDSAVRCPTGVEHHQVGFEGADVCTCW